MFYKSTKKYPESASVISPAFGRLPGLNWPIVSPHYSQMCLKKGQACVKFENYFLQSSASSIWILEKYAIKHWPAHGFCRTRDCSVGVSKQSLLGVSAGSWHGNYCLHFMLLRNSATWSMANFHHHLKLCRQVEELRSSAHMWWMIKVDKWFALLNCPFQRDAH